MNAAHWHLLLNHAPFFGVLIGVLILSYGMVVKNKSILQTALVVFIFSMLIAIPVYLTGDPAAHLIKNIPTLKIDAHLIHEHEEAADIWLCAIIMIGIFSAFIGYWERKNKNQTSILYSFLLIAATIVVAGLANVNYKGAMIRHDEIINSSTSNKAGEKDDD